MPSWTLACAGVMVRRTFYTRSKTLAEPVVVDCLIADCPAAIM